MAGDWIKMRGNLWDDPRVSKLCDLTGQSEASVVGGLYWLWAAADQHTETGVMMGLSTRQIDRKTGVQGLGQALIDIGWIADHPEGIRIVRFEEHNGKSAKKRASTAKRVADCRSGKADVTLNDEECNDDVTQSALQIENESVTGALAREEKRREDILNTIVGSKLPDCPHEKILALYAKHLPQLAQPRVWEGNRQEMLRARWRWVLTSVNPSGQPYATDAESALDFFDRLFRYINKCPFLLGENKTEWTADLAWLVKAENFAKVLEGKYEAKGVTA